jgi:hypothetical protein
MKTTLSTIISKEIDSLPLAVYRPKAVYCSLELHLLYKTESAGMKMKNFQILLLFVAIGLLLFAGIYRPITQAMSGNCVSFCRRFGFKDNLLHAQVMKERISILQVVKTYIKMYNASV